MAQVLLIKLEDSGIPLSSFTVHLNAGPEVPHFYAASDDRLQEIMITHGSNRCYEGRKSKIWFLELIRKRIFFVIGEIYSSSGCSSLQFCLCPRLFFTTSLSNLPSLCILRTEGFIAGLISKGVKGAWKAELLLPC